MYIIEKFPEVSFHVEQFVLAATPFFAYRNLPSQLLKVVHTPSHFQVAIALFFRVIVKKPFMYLAIRVIVPKYISAFEGRR